MKKLIAIFSLLVSFQTSAIEFGEPASEAEHQAKVGFIFAHETVEAARHFYRLYQECPATLKAIGLANYSQLTGNLLANATIDDDCQIKVTFNNQAPVVEELWGKTITIKPDTQQLDKLAGECTFDGPAELAPPSDCQAQFFPFLTQQDTKNIDNFVAAYRTHNPTLLKADTLNELSSLMLLPKTMVAQFYSKHQRCPVDNQEAGISAPEQLSVRFLKGIEVAGCDITATFSDQPPTPRRFKNKTVTYTLHTEPNSIDDATNSAFDWICQSDLANRDLPKDCRPE